MKKHAPGIVLFDGECLLCEGSVQFIIKRDPELHFRFAALQSEIGQRYLAQGPQLPADSFILIEQGQYYASSTAALRVVKRLKGLWPLLYVFIIIPPPLRNAVYRWVARNRYRWFGKRDACMMPTPEMRRHFLQE